MPFNTMGFFLFFIPFWALFHFAAKNRGQKLWCILLGSLFFYGMWDYRFIPLLLFTAGCDFYLALAIEKSSSPKKRKFLLWTSVAVNLGVLGYFKYTNFLLDSAYGILHCLGVQGEPPYQDIILPIGISFYTFQSMSYVIDVYRGELKARRHPQEMFAGVLFFPHLVAGPIIRATTLLPQFENMRMKVDGDKIRRALLLIAVGLLKKGIGDLLSVHVERFYGMESAGTFQSWIGTLAFTGQIYADFAGYTDCAIGVALLLGFQLPDNFNQPYLSSSPSDFWSRWHISLSQWIKDYLFVPLSIALNGRVPAALFVSTVLTMTLCGLWHGANWTFVLFGAYHGILLALAYQFKEWGLFSKINFERPVARFFSVAFTFYLVHLGWVLFRAPSIDGAWKVLRTMHAFSAGTPSPTDAGAFVIVVTAIVFCHLINPVRDAAAKLNFELRAPVEWSMIGSLAALAIAFNGSTTPFIYFQF